MSIDARRLHADLARAGILESSHTGARSAPRPVEDAGKTDPVDWAVQWLPGHPTPAERTLAEQVLATHDPDGDAKEEAAARTRLLGLADKLDAGTATAAEQREMLGKLVRRHLGVR